MTDDAKTQREKLIGKVRALLAKTTANGCTEDEAMAAATMANKLMAEHDLTYTDIETEVRAARYGARRRNMHGPGADPRRRTSHPVSYCLVTVAAYFDCKGWQNGQDIVYFGSETDTELAHAFTDMLRLAMDCQWHRYLNGPSRDPNEHGRTLRASFMRGMVSRLNERIRAMKAERSGSAQQQGSTALVVVKGAVTTEKFSAYCRANNLRLSSGGGGSFRGNAGAYEAGKSAGSRVDLGGSKLSGGSSPRIGGR